MVRSTHKGKGGDGETRARGSGRAPGERRDPGMRQVSGRTDGGTKWGDNGSIIKGTGDTSNFVG